MAPKLSPARLTAGMQPPAPKVPFLIFLLMMPAFIFLLALLLFAMQYKQLRAFVSPQPMAMATVPESPEAQERIHARVHGFFAADTLDTLSISAEDVTHLSRSSRLLMDLHLDYHLDLQDTLLIARNSLPSTTLNGVLSVVAKVTGIKGYLNSEMKAYPEFKEGKITLVPVSAVMNGLPAPVSVLNQNGPVDVKDWVADKAFYQKAISELAGVKIRGSRLILIKKHRS